MSIRIGLASIDGSYVDQHFGSARYWQIYDIDGSGTFVETRKTRPTCNGHCEGGFEAQLEVLKDCDALFVSKIGFRKLVTGKELLFSFDTVYPQFQVMKQHDFAILNGDVIQYVESCSREFTPVETNQAAKSLMRYIDYLRQQHNNEALMHFSHTLHTPIFKSCFDFIGKYAKTIEDALLLMTANMHG